MANNKAFKVRAHLKRKKRPFLVSTIVVDESAEHREEAEIYWRRPLASEMGAFIQDEGSGDSENNQELLGQLVKMTLTKEGTEYVPIDDDPDDPVDPLSILLDLGIDVKEKLPEAMEFWGFEGPEGKD